MHVVLIHEFAQAMDAALRHDHGGVRTLAAIAEYNAAHADACLRYGQASILAALAVERPMLTQEYFEARQRARDGLRALHRSFAEHRLDAVVSKIGLMAFPVTGCPALTLPAGLDGKSGLPVPITLNGLPFSEGRLLAIGAALERAVGAGLRPPCCG
jgi:amidase